jgi:F-type H+-transporting ATPase subunit delta
LIGLLERASRISFPRHFEVESGMDHVEPPTVLDTDQQRIGEIYARSLLAIGQQTGQVDQLLEQLESFTAALAKLPSFRALLESPRIGFEQKAAIIDRALGARATPHFRNFIKVLARHDRMPCLAAVGIAAKKLDNEYRGRVGVTLITAEPIDDEIRQYATARLTQTLGKEIELSARTDPSIIGGAVVRVGDTVYDGSAKNQLRRARAAAVQRAYQEIRDSMNRFAIDT